MNVERGTNLSFSLFSLAAFGNVAITQTLIALALQFVKASQTISVIPPLWSL